MPAACIEPSEPFRPSWPSHVVKIICGSRYVGDAFEVMNIIEGHWDVDGMFS